jgi:hypothetical protein
MKNSNIRHFSLLILAGITMAALAPNALAQQVSRERDIVNLRLGQRVKVDDGTCPAGQVKEVSGAKMIATGIVHKRKCVPRLGPRIK